MRRGGGGRRRYTLQYTLPSNICCSALPIVHLLGLLWYLPLSSNKASHFSSKANICCSAFPIFHLLGLLCRDHINFKKAYLLGLLCRDHINLKKHIYQVFSLGTIYKLIKKNKYQVSSVGTIYKLKRSISTRLALYGPYINLN